MGTHLRMRSGAGVSFFAFLDIITSVTGVLILVTLMLTLYLNDVPDAAAAPEDEARAELARLREQVEQVTATNEWLQKIAGEVEGVDEPRLEAELARTRDELESLAQAEQQLERELADRRQSSRDAEQKLGLADFRSGIEELKKQIEAAENANAAAEAEIDLLQEQLRTARENVQRARQDQHRLWVIPEADRAGKQALLVVVSGRGFEAQRHNQPATLQRIPPSRTAELFRNIHSDRDFLVFYIRPSGIELFNQCRDAARERKFEVGYDAVEEHAELLFSRPEHAPAEP